MDDGALRFIPRENAQWRITQDGIESIPGNGTPEFLVETDDVTSVGWRDGESYYHWPVHLAEKNWVDIDAFMHLFLIAVFFAPNPPKDSGVMERSFELASEIRRYDHSRIVTRARMQPAALSAECQDDRQQPPTRAPACTQPATRKRTVKAPKQRRTLSKAALGTSPR